MHKDFIVRANVNRSTYLLQTEALFVANKSTWFDTLAEHFISVCDQIQKMQAETTLPTVSYLEYTMLYTNFINRRYVVEVWVYDDEYYLAAIGNC